MANLSLAVSDPLLRAYELKKQNFSVLFSQAENKRPFGAWGRHIRRPATTNQLLKQFIAFGKKYPGQEPNIVILGGLQPDGSKLAIMDNDTPEAFEKAKELFPDTFTVQSSTGKGHVYFKTDSLKGNSKLDGGDIKATGGYVLAPYSKRSDGSRYLPINNNGIKIINHELPLKESPLVRKQPSAFVFDILKLDYKITGSKENNNKNKKEFRSRSEAEYSAVLNMVGDGFTFPEIKEIFDSYSNKHTKYKKWNKDSKEGGYYGNTSYLKQCYERAMAWEEKHKSYCNRDDINHLTIHSLSIKFDWRGGTSDQLLYHSFLKRALKSGRSEFFYSLDEMAVDTGRSPQTVAKTLKRLQNNEFIFKIKKPTWNLATVWRLNMSPAYLVSQRIKRKDAKKSYKKAIRTSVDSSSGALLPSLQDRGQLKSVIDNLMMSEHDFFTFKPTLTRLFMELRLLGTSTKTEISRATGMAYKTIAKNLAILAKTGLLNQEKRNFSIVENPNLDQAAEILGVTGQREAIKQNLERERLERYTKARMRFLNSINQPVYSLATGETFEC